MSDAVVKTAFARVMHDIIVVGTVRGFTERIRRNDALSDFEALACRVRESRVIHEVQFNEDRAHKHNIRATFSFTPPVSS